jgi:hypothetical protein
MSTPLMSDRRRKRLLLTNHGSTTVIGVGEMDIWDGADLALIRDTLHELIEEQGLRDVGIEMKSVKYVPSGFFGMLSEWNDLGVRITLHFVQPIVQRMLWFRHFFLEIDANCYQLQSEPVIELQEENFLDDEPCESADPPTWTDLEREHSLLYAD